MTPRAIAAALVCVAPLWAQKPAAWEKLEFLVGNWTAVEAQTDPRLGPGRGFFSFEPDLNKTIIVRRNHAQYDSGEKHDDLMVIYTDGAPRAIYFDSEGHTIRYNATFPGANRVVFESEGTPRYRLSYWLNTGLLKGLFEIAGDGGGYKTYMSWSSKRER